MNKPSFCKKFFLTAWRHMRHKNTIEISSFYWNVLLWIFSNWSESSEGNNFIVLFKGNAQFVKKVTFEPLLDFQKTIMEVQNIVKTANFKIFLHLSYKNTITFFVTVLFNIFMRQKLTDDFWGLHKNMNCTFPLSIGTY